MQVDGGSATTIDQYAATRQENVLVYRSGAELRRHAVRVTVRGTHQSAWTGNAIAIDRGLSTG